MEYMQSQLWFYYYHDISGYVIPVIGVFWLFHIQDISTFFIIYTTIRWYPAKKALPAMLAHGR